MMEFANNLTRAAQPIERNRGQPSTKILSLEAQTKGLIFGKINWNNKAEIVKRGENGKWWFICLQDFLWLRRPCNLTIVSSGPWHDPVTVFQEWYYLAAQSTSPRPAARSATSRAYQTGSGGRWSRWPPWVTATWRVYTWPSIELSMNIREVS